MAPPPATPTPHRFLVPKRSQSRSETPHVAFQPSSQQFQATPRFSLHSTPHKGPSSSITPFRHRGTGHDVVIDSSPPPVPRQDHVSYDEADDDGDYVGLDDEYQRNRTGFQQDTIIDEDDVVHQSSPLERGSDCEAYDMNEERDAKRRRISISSPDIGIQEPSTFLLKTEDILDVDMQDTASAVESLRSEPTISENDEESDVAVIQDAAEGTEDSSPCRGEKLLVKAHRPTFQKPPRFKPAELPGGAPRPEPLPDVFSPQRKGAKYVAGGLAAELRDWLVDVEAGFGSSSIANTTARDEEWVARIQVDDTSDTSPNARGMTLVQGRQILSNKVDANNNSQAEGRNEEAGDVLGHSIFKLILAGPGRLSGLGIGNDVRPGVVIGIARPTWEVVLDGLGRWGVACDWVVLR
ncbi:hypothetical protein F5B22DRAFT_610888 [Xylaria bambusicola]|uniref:uncharacterized protein n=1 Tax=Xylaria bambusicola TaxID=326684 RepID=UPI00200885B6|nr:uncharacterized protein F5B22DRAFT_610888 [Xylaria bambusicola]KAI0514551.1 hypothetical protein F5B22DRAFT_610888 [Xylaria bambusicola]